MLLLLLLLLLSSKRTEVHLGIPEKKKENSEVLFAHAKHRNQKRGSYAYKNIFNISHASTAFRVAGSKINSDADSRKSNQKYGFVRVSLTQKQDAVQRPYSMTIIDNTAIWKN